MRRVRALLAPALIAAALAAPAPATADITFADGTTTRFHFGCDSYFHSWLVQARTTGGGVVYWRVWLEDPGGTGAWGPSPTAWELADIRLTRYLNMPTALQGRWLRFWVDYYNANTGETYGEFLKISQDHFWTYDGWCWF